MAPQPHLVSGSAVPARRASGLIVLLIAVVLALGTSAVLNHGVTGSAAPVAFPAPPPVGSCLLLTADTVDVVPCTDGHHAEVMQTWPAGVLPEGIPDFAAVSAYPFGGGGQVSTTGCVQAQQVWVQRPYLPGTGIWNPTTPVVDSQLLAAPPTERAADRGWIACILVAPDRQLLTASLRVGATTGPPPSRLSSCVLPATTTWGPVTLTCDQPHRIEILASFRIRSAFDVSQHFTGMPDDATLSANCTALAAAVTGNSDPTYGGRLDVKAVSLFPGSIREVNATDPAGNPVRTYIPLPQCAVDLVGDGVLTGTVVGLGDAPLPLG